MYYTGIGSRLTPTKTLNHMALIASILGKHNWVLRSGGASGADSAFETRAKQTEIYIPWPKFQGHPSELSWISVDALTMAAQFHPNWNACSPGARKLHARNCYQVLGLNLKTPSNFIVCWTPNGKHTGGTGQALRIAKHHHIPIFNLATCEYTDILDFAKGETI